MGRLSNPPEAVSTIADQVWGKQRRAPRASHVTAAPAETRRRAAELTCAATSIAAIATAAGVSQRTVYNTFGGKAVLLRRYVESSMVGDHDDRPIAERDWANGAYQAPTATERIAVLAATSARIMANAGEALRVAWQAASSGDASIAEEWRRGQAHRRTTANRFIDTMANDELLDRRIDTTAAKHTVWLLLAPETYSQMTQDSGLTNNEFQTWLDHNLRRLLLIENQHTDEPGQNT